ncbi:uncharacterized protein LOC116195247 [Punica granatum]|uniref:Uncharacterized protein n=2 Tax=Punica granatum TaxID=22663 RepID=A0A218X7W5_PUNGR|nr:uncharacterized protein LOC116195247 [Punica granatum]XP_031380130.1 uncharacterized protein LOC116195247 [Punica granatum]XP_031380140.1 uncharacterized protein LOC116195247 [Punica granatum]OWM81033.1 hypothetical protein CDL15_Pgr007064 [Punica granatum]PKI47652.1 hypothetical protein CRG98_031938 [Punica granatum]
MAIKSSSSVELFFPGEEDNDFGFELLFSQWELIDPSDAFSVSNSNLSDPDIDLGSSSAINQAIPIPYRVTADRAFFRDNNGQWVDRAGNPACDLDQIMLAAGELASEKGGGRRRRGGGAS